MRAAQATPARPMARQRLGWGVKEAIPFSIAGGRMGHNMAVLYAQRDQDTADRIAILSGADYVYDVLWTYGGVLGGRIADHAGRFGLTDVDGDGTPEVWEVNDASGSGAWGMGAALIDTGNGERYEAFAGGSWDEPARRETLEVELTGRAGPSAERY